MIPVALVLAAYAFGVAVGFALGWAVRWSCCRDGKRCSQVELRP